MCVRGLASLSVHYTQPCFVCCHACYLIHSAVLPVLLCTLLTTLSCVTCVATHVTYYIQPCYACCHTYYIPAMSRVFPRLLLFVALATKQTAFITDAPGRQLQAAGAGLFSCAGRQLQAAGRVLFSCTGETAAGCR